MTHTITQIFDSHAQALEAIDALERAGFAKDDISTLTQAPDGSVESSATSAAEVAGAGAGVGAAVGGGAGLLAGLGLMAIPGIGPIVASGWFAATAAGAAAGAVVGGATGGIVGALMANGATEDEAHVYAESLRRGGTLLTMRAPDDRAAEATRIISRFSAVTMAERGAAYRQTGWQAFDAAAPVYRPELPPATPAQSPMRTPPQSPVKAPTP